MIPFDYLGMNCNHHKNQSRQTLTSKSELALHVSIHYSNVSLPRNIRPSRLFARLWEKDPPHLHVVVCTRVLNKGMNQPKHVFYSQNCSNAIIICFFIVGHVMNCECTYQKMIHITPTQTLTHSRPSPIPLVARCRHSITARNNAYK